MNTLEVIQHETTHISTAISAVALSASSKNESIANELKKYKVHFDLKTTELAFISAEEVKTLHYVSAFAPCFLGSQQDVLKAINSRYTSQYLSEQDKLVIKGFNQSNICDQAFKLSLIAGYSLYKSIGAVKRARIVEAMTKASEHITLNDFFEVEQIRDAIAKATNQLLNVELGKNLNSKPVTSNSNSIRFLKEKYHV